MSLVAGSGVLYAASRPAAVIAELLVQRGEEVADRDARLARQKTLDVIEHSTLASPASLP